MQTIKYWSYRSIKKTGFLCVTRNLNLVCKKQEKKCFNLKYNHGFLAVSYNLYETSISANSKRNYFIFIIYIIRIFKGRV